MKTSELQGLTVKELQKFATDLGSTDSSGLLKQELIKEILEIVDTLCGYILIIYGLKLTFRKVKLNKRSDCYCNEKKK